MHHWKAAVEHSSYVAAIAERSGIQLWRSRNAIAQVLVRFRLLAFTSEVGESFRPLMDLWKVQLAYAVSWAYVLLDVLLRACDEFALRGRTLRILRTLVFFSVFHTIATMLLPALLIHAAVHRAEQLFHGLLPPSVARSSHAGILRRFAPSAIGVALIPVMPLLDSPCEHALEALFKAAWPLPKKVKAPAALTDYEVVEELELRKPSSSGSALEQGKSSSPAAIPDAPLGHEEPELQRLHPELEPQYPAVPNSLLDATTAPASAAQEAGPDAPRDGVANQPSPLASELTSPPSSVASSGAVGGA